MRLFTFYAFSVKTCEDSCYAMHHYYYYNFYPRGAECPNTVGRPESLLRHVAGFGGGGGEATTARQGRAGEL